MFAIPLGRIYTNVSVLTAVTKVCRSFIFSWKTFMDNLLARESLKAELRPTGDGSDAVSFFPAFAHWSLGRLSTSLIPRSSLRLCFQSLMRHKPLHICCRPETNVKSGCKGPSRRRITLRLQMWRTRKVKSSHRWPEMTSRAVSWKQHWIVHRKIIVVEYECRMSVISHAISRFSVDLAFTFTLTSQFYFITPWLFRAGLVRMHSDDIFQYHRVRPFDNIVSYTSRFASVDTHPCTGYIYSLSNAK